MPEEDAARYRALHAEVRGLRAEVQRQAEALDAFMEDVEIAISVLLDALAAREASPRPQTRRGGLGRGLDALIPRSEDEPES